MTPGPALAEAAAAVSPPPAKDSLFTFEFVTLTLAIFFGFCNLAIFFGFYVYLGRIGIPAEWRGLLVSLEPLAAFLVRLPAIPLLNANNAFRTMLVSFAMIIAALWGYSFATTLPALVVLRLFHGAAFVLMVSSATFIVVGLIPPARSGQGFAVVSVALLVPYAVMPLLTDALARWIPNEAHVYAAVSVLAVPCFFLAAASRRRIARRYAATGAPPPPPALRQLLRNLGQAHYLLILGINLALTFCTTTVFYFMKDFFLRAGYGDAGIFFTLSTGAVIATRVTFARALDRFDKPTVLGLSLPPLAGCFLLFAYPGGLIYIGALALLYGAALGIAQPLLNALMFAVSPPPLRGANANLMQLVMDAGYFISPSVGGLLLARGCSFFTVFATSAAMALLGLVLLLLLVAGGLRERIARGVRDGDQRA
ncbi:MAG: MFS transporter [Acidobacteria bacterium]|nr:MFS transporter [Acidobacteriota bacterium]